MAEQAAALWQRGPLRPFRHVPYRWLAAALTLSLFADGIWMIASVWQVIALDGGPGHLSFVAAGWSAGVIGTTLLGGVLADRISRRLIVLGVSMVRLTVAAIVGLVAAAGQGEIWHLAVAGLLFGMTAGIFFPAYSAILPSIVATEDLLAANGIEGMLRPTMLQALGPAAASLLVAVWSPGYALVAVAVVEAGCLVTLTLVDLPESKPPEVHDTTSGKSGMLGDLATGFAYMVRTPWLLGTLLFATVLVLASAGPMEVLVPFVIKDDLGGDATDHAWVMAAYGLGGAVASLAVASLPMPRRYLSVMILSWGIGMLPLAAVGFMPNVVALAGLACVVGALFSAPNVIWGTLLQRRVPPELLGRVSSLDFFVSLAFMPVSMAIAGPLGVAFGHDLVFGLAGLIPLPLALLVLWWAKMPRDELAHPLHDPGSAGPDSPEPRGLS